MDILSPSEVYDAYIYSLNNNVRAVKYISLKQQSKNLYLDIIILDKGQKYALELPIEIEC